jgi:hypothetical protein
MPPGLAAVLFNLQVWLIPGMLRNKHRFWFDPLIENPKSQNYSVMSARTPV